MKKGIFETEQLTKLIIAAIVLIIGIILIILFKDKGVDLIMKLKEVF